MQLTLFRLQPHGAFHFGAHGIEMEAVLETCPSDTLYAALTWHAIQRGDSWAREASTTTPLPPFRVSSCFPYVGTMQLFPLPLLPPPTTEQQQPGERKLFKKIRFVSTTVFRRLLAGGSLREFFAPDVGTFLQGGSVLASKAECEAAHWPSAKPLWQTETIPHVAVDRISNASAYYETGQIRFNAGCGLAVLANGDTTALHSLLRDVGYAGLGGRRSKGVGQFEVALGEPIELPSATSERHVLLSRYLPSQAELGATPNILGDKAAYALEDVTGWLYAPGTRAQRRQSIWMIAAGSTLHSATNAPPRGDIVDLRPIYASDTGAPHHAVWRHGLALTVGAPLQEDV